MIKRFNKILRENEIIRRYIVINSFDGALTVLGIILAEFVAGISNSQLIILPSLGAGIAMCISGIWGAYVAEVAEVKRSLENLEKHLMRDLNGTKLQEKMEKTTFLVAIVDGLSPLIVVLIIVSPFFLPFGITASYYSSFIVSAVILFFLGSFVGSVARESRILYGIKMLAAGVVIGLLFYILAISGLL